MIPDADTLTAIAAIITALGIPVLGWFTYLSAKASRATTGEIGEVHTVVNSANEALVEQARRQADRVEALVVALSEAGLTVPDTPEEGG